MGTIAAPPSIVQLLGRIGDEFQRLLGDDLIGIYVHGSLAFGCFNPATSDVDLIAVVQTRLDTPTKRRIAKTLIDLSGDAPPKGLELSIVTLPVLQDFRVPTPYEFHFGMEWIDRYVAGDVDFNTERSDPDLAAHLTVVRQYGIRLVGEPIDQVVPPIPRRAYLESIAADVAWARPNLVTDPAYGVLNLCRTLAFIREGLVLSKAGGAAWAIEHVPAPFVPLVQAALDFYTGATQEHPDIRG
jgi:predicted nucleotidyltransferase